MNLRNKYGIIFLSATLMPSLLFPFCCHAENSKGASHPQEISEHAAHSQDHNEVDCSCGHRLIQDFQKNKNIASSLSLQLNMGSEAIAFVPVNILSPSTLKVVHTVQEMPRPPVHLLNSVFLN